MKFRFRLEKVRKARQNVEDERARALREAQDELDQALEARRTLESIRQNNQEQLRQAHGTGKLTAAQLGILLSTLDMVDRGVTLAKEAETEAGAQVEQATSDYLDARSERKALDVLEERQAQEHRRQESKKEDQDNEEIARILSLLRKT